MYRKHYQYKVVICTTALMPTKIRRAKGKRKECLLYVGSRNSHLTNKPDAGDGLIFLPTPPPLPCPPLH